MKNRLENEYRQLMQNETPDLWKRIEEGIENTIQEQPEDSTENRIKNKAGRKKYIIHIAACVAACICIPAVVTGVFRPLTGISRKNFEECPQEDMMTDGDAADCVKEEEQSVITQEAAKEKLTEEMQEDKTAGILADEEAPDQETLVMEEAETFRKESGNEEDTAASFTLYIREVFSEEIVYSENNPAGTLYRIRDAKQGNCAVFVPSGMNWTVEAGKAYEAVEPEEESEYDYELVRPVE